MGLCTKFYIHSFTYLIAPGQLEEIQYIKGLNVYSDLDCK